MTVELKMSHNLPTISARFGRKAKQIPFATAVALNKTALDAQRYEQAHIMRVFTVRAQRWMSRQVKHKPRATKRKQWTKLAIDPPGGRNKAGVIGQFEQAHQKTPRRRHIAIPSMAKRTGSGRIRSAQRIAGFNFRRVGGSWHGDKRTWIIENGPSAGIYQRMGAKRKKRAKRGTSNRAKGRYKMLYAFASSVPIDNRLKFDRNIRRTVHKQYPVQFSAAWREAMRTAR